MSQLQEKQSAQHTPGPWVVEPMGEDQVHILAVGNSSVVCSMRKHPVTGRFVEANARLIAAAPELLEALEALMPSNLGALPATMPDAATLPLDVSFGELRRARAAIAKARGEG